MTTERPTDLLDGCRRAVAGARALVEGVRPEDLAKPTPCEGWDVRTLIGHLVGVAENFTNALRGGEVDPGVARGSRDLGDADPSAAFARAARSRSRSASRSARSRPPLRSGSSPPISSSIPGTWPRRSGGLTRCRMTSRPRRST
jgi:uncharacterized protein (TIGR03083 family)